MKKFYLTIFTTLLFFGKLTAQQDCCEATVITGGSFSVGGNSGNGTDDQVSSCSCLATNEHDSYWFTFQCITSGTFEMMITPAGLSADFDFSLYANACPCDAGMVVVSCDYTGPISAPGPFVPTGISSTPMATFGVPGATEFQGTVSLTAGTTYYLIADNITTNGAGFDIEFAGSAVLGAPPSSNTPGPTPLNGAQTVCPGATVEYSVPPNATYNGYLWTVTPPTVAIDDSGGNSANITFTSTGSYNVCVQGLVGCSNTQPTCKLVNVNEIVTQPVNDIICVGGVFTAPDGNTYSSPGTYTMPFTSWQGCDSSVVLNLTAVPSSSTFLDIEVCDGECYEIGGQTYCLSGVYSEILTNFNGCDSTVLLNLIVVPNEAIITGDEEIPCEGLALLSGLSSLGGLDMDYTWTNQSGNVIGTLSDLFVSTPGTYTLTISSEIGGDICTDETQFTVSANAPPNATAAGGAISCTTPSTTLTGNSTTPGAIFTWTGPGGFTSDLQNPTTSVVGTYTLTVTAPNGCTATATAPVTGNSGLPNATATSGSLDCNATTTYLQGNSTTSGVSYAWTGPNGFTSNQQNPANISLPGTYVLTVTAANGCSAQASTNVSQNTAVPNVSTTGGGSIDCNANSLQLQGISTTAGVSYAWVGPGGFSSASQNPTVGLEGTYTLTVTGTNGCTASSSETVTANQALPNATASGGTINCDSPNLTLLGSSTTPGVSYNWSGPGGFSSTEQNPNTSLPGTYTLTVLSQNGCSTTATTLVDEDFAVPNASATGGILTCTAGSVNLIGSSSSSGVSYSWAGPGGFTSASQNPTVASAGNYVLTVTAANGCTASSTATVQQDAGLPDVFAGANDSLDCNVSSVQLAGGSATQGVSLVWSGPGGFSSTQLNPTVTVAGAYVLTATATNNCTSQALATVVLDDQAPDASAFGGTLTCTETSIMLDGESDEPGASFAWSAVPAGSNIGNTEDLVVSSPGTYLLTVTGTNGCTSTASAIVAANADAPSVSAVGGQIDCAQTEVTLDGNSTTAGANFAWSGPAGFTSSQIDTTTSIPGTYTLTVTSSNGCSALAQVEVTADNQAPTALADGGILSCGAAAIDLEGNSTTAGVSYAWTGPGGFISAEQNPSVSVPGNYVLTVTAANGCTGADLAIVAQDANAPVAVAIGGTIDCQQTSLQLQGSSQTNGVQYSWTGPGGFTSTQQNPTVSQDGNYVLTVTAPNGCVGVANAQVDADDTLPDASAVGGMLSCSSTGVGLTGSSITAGAIFAWSGPGGFSSNEQNPTVATAGTYTLTVTAPNGCTSTADATVTNDSNLPNVTASAPELDCNTTSIMLDGGSTTPNVSYAWAGPGGFVASIADPTATIPGNYVLTVTAPNGCASSFNLVVSQDIAQPSATASGGQITCADPTLVITGSSTTAGVTWAWTGPNNFTSSQQNPSISQAGTYILTVTAANGCTSSSSATVTADAGIPALTTTGGTLNCLVNEVQLTANSSISSVEYEWTGPSGFSSTEQSPIVSQSGTYTLMVTTSAGCTTSAQAIVVADTGTPDVNIGPTQELDCVTTSIVLDGSSSNSGQGFDFEWTSVGGNFESGQNTLTPTVNAQGTYSLTITGPNGCSSTASVLVQISDEAPNGALLTVLPPDCFGDENGSIAVSAVTGGIPPYLYSIDNQSFTTSSVFTNLAPGEYEITVEDATGCTWQTAVTIDETPELLVNLETDLQTDLLLLGDSMELEAQITIPASDLSAVVWSPVGIDANCLSCLRLTVAPQIATTYSITVSDQNGCTASDEVLVLVNPGKSIYVPSAFSPNDDGINDILAVFGSRSVSRIKSFVIFSRWGETMYEYYNFVPNDPAKGWDGTHRGEQLNPAVFTWFAEVEYIDGKSDVFKGDVSLFR